MGKFDRRPFARGKGAAMHLHRLSAALATLALTCATVPSARAACCYFSAQNTDILQPAQKVFISWDPEKKMETFTVQPKFEGNALDFGMVIPTPSQPKLHEMPRDFFKHLAVYSILMRREVAQSKLLMLDRARLRSVTAIKSLQALDRNADDKTGGARKPDVVVREQGVVGSLDYKTMEARRADHLCQWLKHNK